MIKKNIFPFLLLAFSCIQCTNKYEYDYKNPDIPREERVNDLLKRLSIEEKISLLIASSEAIPHLDIEKYYHGNEALHGVVRPGRATVFPQAIALAATWNPDLIRDVGTVISDEARAKWNYYQQGKEQKSYFSDVLTFWSPTVNMARDPRWGRTPETYGEDPWLTSKIGVSFVKGLQGDDEKYLKVVSTPKHFAANNEEHNRFECDAVISNRALREYYLKGFEACVVEGKAQSIMSAYNAINGIPCTANQWLLNDLLRKEWGFDGYVVSDCGAIKALVNNHHFVDTKEEAAKVAIEAGLDLECGDDVYKNFLLKAYEQGLVDESYINTAAYNVLNARFKLGLFDPAESNPYSSISPEVVGSEKHQSIALETARQSIVLLKNEKQTLPLNKSKLKNIAILGPNASNIAFGDYSGKPVIKAISALEGIRAAAGNEISITHVPWKAGTKSFNLIEEEFLSNDASEEAGLYAEYFNNMDLEGSPKTRIDMQVNYEAVSQPPDPVISDAPMSIRWSGYLNPRTSGNYKIKVNSSDGCRLWLNDMLLIDEWHGRGETSDIVEFEMVENQKYSIKLEYFVNRDDEICQLFWETPGTNSTALYTADMEAARESDCVIAVMGINKSTEREGLDRTTIDLPKEQVDYLKDIYKENKNVVVVLIAGSALAINWIDANIPAIVEAWYPGESGGTAIADVLFGKYNPGGRLPFTFYRSTDDLPAFDDYDIYNGRTYMYFEGEALYPFGYGLSYTNFEYNQLSVDRKNGEISVQLQLKNIGDREGDEVVQLYISDVESSLKRPQKQLVGFERETLLPNGSEIINFKVNQDQLRFWDDSANDWGFEAGEFQIMVGSSSEDIRLDTILFIN